MKFILVNDRTPREPSACAGCSKPLGLGYLREMSTHHVYCECECYHRHRKTAGITFGRSAPDLWSTAMLTHLSGLYADGATPAT